MMYIFQYIHPSDSHKLGQAELVCIDEAAAIPVPMLTRMLKFYQRCIFSTTLYGYEGSGRGFVLRFQKVLDEVSPDWLDVQLHEPIRWGAGDQLEAFMNHWLIMDGGLEQENTLLQTPSFERGILKGQASPVSRKPRFTKMGESKRGRLHAFAASAEDEMPYPVSSTTKADKPVYSRYSQSELAANESKLRGIFSLLVNAHYQTRPSDLRQLLDAPQISIHVIEQNEKVVAVALLSHEGGLEEGLVADIHAGKRRPHGHLLAQSLTFHAGIEHAACLKCQRIMRIAVHPNYQYQGVGQFLLVKLNEYTRQQQADYLGVSYALSPGLLAFWRKAGFASVRLGFRKDTASGSRSLMQVRGLSDKGIALSRHAQQLFQTGLPDWLEKLGDVPEALADELQREFINSEAKT